MARPIPARERFLAVYRAARDDFLQDVAQLIGGNILSVELDERGHLDGLPPTCRRPPTDYERMKDRPAMDSAPLIRLTGMYENTAAKSGRRYFVGYLGGVKLLLLENLKAEPGEPGWNLCVTARPERQDAPRKPATAPPEREPAMAGTSSPAPAAPARPRPSRTPQREGALDDDPEPFDDPLPF